jgi:hypothetical protein
VKFEHPLVKFIEKRIGRWCLAYSGRMLAWSERHTMEANVRDFVRAVRAALRAMRAWVWRVADGVLQLVQTEPTGGFTEPEPAEANAGQAETDDLCDRLERIRALALELVRNPDVPPAEMMRGIGPVTGAWLATMSNPMLLRIATSSDDELADHVAGRRSIRGVLAHEASTIDDYRRVMAQTPADDDFDLDETLVPAI